MNVRFGLPALAALAAGSLFAAQAPLTGPLNNPDDQFRYIWDASEKVLPDLVNMGINTVINGGQLAWDVPAGKPKQDPAQWAADHRKRLDAYRNLGLGYVQRYVYGWDGASMEKYPRIRRDGSKQPKHIDASVPEYVASVRKAVETQVRLVGDHPALVGTLTESETRGFVEPSFTPANAAAYRAFSGKDVPAETNGRNPVPWQKRKDFPKDRIVDDDDNLLRFYRWQWTAGDGWTGYLDMIADTFRANCSHPVMAMYDPTLRCLSQWRNIGPAITHLNHWTYPYPEPYRVGYDIAEMQATARGIPGQKVLAMIQAISYRSVTAPIGEHPASEAAWAREFAACKYPTTAPDMMQEAIWTAFARKVDGIGFHGWDALYESGNPHATHQGYMCTNPETARRIGRLFHEVGEPLGPLLKSVPERAPEVAILESCAAEVLGGHIGYSCHTYFSHLMFIAVAANLAPYVIYDDEIRATGIPASVKTLVLPKADVLTRSEYVAIKAFQAKGGRLVGDAMLLPALKADATFPTLQEEAKNQKGDFDDGIVRKADDAEVRARSVQSAAAKLKAACAVDLYADSDNADILVHPRSWKSADYVFAINSKRKLGSYMGPWRRVLEEGVPNAGTVTVRRSAGAVYDLVKHAPVPFTVKDGVTSVPVKYDTNDGRAFLLTDAPLKGLTYRLDGTKLTVYSPDRDVMIPIRIDGVGKKPWYAVVKDGVWSRDIAQRTGTSVVPGETQRTGTSVVPEMVRVTNLADNRIAAEDGLWDAFCRVFGF